MKTKYRDKNAILELASGIIVFAILFSIIVFNI